MNCSSDWQKEDHQGGHGEHDRDAQTQVTVCVFSCPGPATALIFSPLLAGTAPPEPSTLFVPSLVAEGECPAALGDQGGATNAAGPLQALRR